MEKRLQIAVADRKPGSYLRGDAAGDVLHTFFRYKEFSITFAPGPSIRYSIFLPK